MLTTNSSYNRNTLFQSIYKKYSRYRNSSKLSIIAKLIKFWEGLGYYSRVRNLKKAAQVIVKDFNKKLPSNFLELKSLPGIGDYTASAISAIAFNKPTNPIRRKY